MTDIGQDGGAQPGGPLTCPFNPNHQPAAKWDSKFPYNGARWGLKGKGKGGYQVPAPGDEAHRFIAPDPEKDIRGPCPGLNALANHGFIARDGITNYAELTDALQNAYNVGYDLANFLAAFSIYAADGDPITRKLSIGCDATSRTSWNPLITGSEPGLNGHSKMEIDVSLTRNDFFPAGGDNFSFNGTLFKMMRDSTGGLFDLEGLAKYRFERYVQCREENPQFYFPVLSVFQYGAASFVYELFPNGNEGYVPNLQNTETFFGAKWNEAKQNYDSVPERIPNNWINRKTPYTLPDIVGQIIAMYGKYPVPFGGNAGGKFVGIDFPPFIKGGESSATTPQDVSCLLFQIISRPIPSSLNGVVTPVVDGLSALLVSLFGKEFENLGCPFRLT